MESDLLADLATAIAVVAASLAAMHTAATAAWVVACWGDVSRTGDAFVRGRPVAGIGAAGVVMFCSDVGWCHGCAICSCVWRCC